jgi:hypothetical protein
VLSCGIYQTDAGLETRAGDGDDLLRSQYAALITTARELAAAWRMAAIEKGFSDVTTSASSVQTNDVRQHE